MTTRAPLAVLCAAQFVLILDIAVVNVTLVPLAADLDVAPGSLQLVGSAYAACFGGALLAGGRLADGGRRRGTFLAGLVLFAAASVLCAVAWSVPVLVLARALQGLGGALASPAALSLLTTAYAEGGPRERALGVWAGVAAAGGAAGLLAGGVLTELAGWRSVFLVNVPIVAVVVLAALRVLPADGRPAGPRLPVGPAAAACAAVVLLVSALGAVEAEREPAVVLGLLAGAAVVAVLFAVGDGRARDPLLPRLLLRSRAVLAANAVTALMSAVVLGVNFFLAVHLQDRLGLGPVGTGLAFLPITVVSAVTAAASARAVGRVGAGRLLVAGMLLLAAGSALLARLPDDGSYVAAVLPGMVLVAAGMGPGFAVGSIAATAGVRPDQQGAAAALLSTSTQAGAAVGLAVLGVLASRPADAAAGTRLAFAAMAVAGVLAAAIALLLPGRPARPARPAGRTVPAGAVDPAGAIDPAGAAGPVRVGGTPLLVPAQAAGCLPGCVQSAGAVPAPDERRAR